MQIRDDLIVEDIKNHLDWSRLGPPTVEPKKMEKETEQLIALSKELKDVCGIHIKSPRHYEFSFMSKSETETPLPDDYIPHDLIMDLLEEVCRDVMTKIYILKAMRSAVYSRLTCHRNICDDLSAQIKQEIREYKDSSRKPTKRSKAKKK